MDRQTAITALLAAIDLARCEVNRRFDDAHRGYASMDVATASDTIVSQAREAMRKLGLAPPGSDVKELERAASRLAARGGKR